MNKVRAHKPISELELRAMASNGMSVREIAERKGLHFASVRTTMAMLGIKTHGRGGAPNRAEKLHGWVKLLRSGLTCAEVGAIAGMSGGSVSAALRKANLPTTCRAAIEAERTRESTQEGENQPAREFFVRRWA